MVVCTLGINVRVRLTLVIMAVKSLIKNKMFSDWLGPKFIVYIFLKGLPGKVLKGFWPNTLTSNKLPNYFQH